MGEIFAAFSAEGSSMKDIRVSTAHITMRACGLPVRSMHFHQEFIFSWKILVIEDFRVPQLILTAVKCSSLPGPSISCSLPVLFSSHIPGSTELMWGSSQWPPRAAPDWKVQVINWKISYTDIKSHLYFVSREDENSCLAPVVKCVRKAAGAQF